MGASTAVTPHKTKKAREIRGPFAFPNATHTAYGNKPSQSPHIVPPDMEPRVAWATWLHVYRRIDPDLAAGFAIR